MTPSGLGQLAGIGAVVARWERFHLNPPPSSKEFEALAKVVGVSAERLAEMLPPKGFGMQWTPIRLCGACYEETSCHLMAWQYRSVWKCDRHQLKLLSKCPNCEAPFKQPSLWGRECCERCQMPFAKMRSLQKQVEK